MKNSILFIGILLIPLASASAQITIGIGGSTDPSLEWHRSYPMSYWMNDNDNDHDHDHDHDHDRGRDHDRKRKHNRGRHRRHMNSSDVYNRGYSQDSYGRSYYGNYPSHTQNRGLYFNLFGK